MLEFAARRREGWVVLDVRRPAAKGASLLAGALAVLVLTAGCGESGGHQEASDRWDYVALGDSVPFGSGDATGRSFVFSYARFVERDTGALVVVHNLASDGGTSRDLLEQLRRETRARRLLVHAEIVTISIGVNDLESQIGGYVDHACGGPDNQRCFRRALANFERNWPVLLRVLLRLRSTDQAIIRVTNDYNPFPGNAQAADNLGYDFARVFTPYLRRLNAYRCMVAERKGVLCANVAQAFNGPEEDKSAFAKGLIGSDEFAHPSAKGHLLIARTLRALGYRPLH
jgi:lysophospholipase L1-like esterase